MMRLTEIFILSSGGDCLAHKAYRQGSSRDSIEVFHQRLGETSPSSAVPYFESHGKHYFYIKRQQVILVTTTEHQTAPICVMEFLNRVYHLLKDFCGAVSEEALRTNIVLVYEVLDELMDYGFVQISSTEKIKPYIQSEPVPVKNPENMAAGLFGIEHRVAPSQAANKPVIRSRTDQEQRKNEVFVDVIERMNVLIASNGSVARCEVNGKVNMKSFLVGTPKMKVGLNEDLSLGALGSEKGYGSHIHLDDCVFHECVKVDELQESRILSIHPPEGEFTVMTYRMHGDLPQGLPFHVYSYVKDGTSLKDVEVGVKLRCEIPASYQAVNITVSLPVPKSTISITQQLSGPGQSAEFINTEKRVSWTIKKLNGKNEASAHFKLINACEAQTVRLELGPVALDFEISGFVCSNLQIRFLRVYDREHSYVPSRWVRYITTADSYICKLP